MANIQRKLVGVESRVEIASSTGACQGRIVGRSARRLACPDCQGTSSGEKGPGVWTRLRQAAGVAIGSREPASTAVEPVETSTVPLLFMSSQNMTLLLPLTVMLGPT
jgi:hypothetical protein